MAELVITQPSGRVTRHRLDAGERVIGRDASCDLPLIDDPAASRRHARFHRTIHGFVVEDLGSKNGTLVNDMPCTSNLLKDGDRLVIGASTVVFQDKESTTAPSVTIADETPSRATRYLAREGELNLSAQRLRILYQLSERLTTLQGQDSLLADAIAVCFDHLRFERGAIGIRRPGARALDWPVVRNLRGAAGELTISRTLLNRSLEHGERALFTLDDAANSDPTVSIVQLGIRSAMCVPIRHNEQTLGIMYGDCTGSTVAYTSEDIDFFAAIAQQVSIGLQNCRLLEEQQRNIRLNHDIDMARQIQTGLFPAAFPGIPGLRFAALNEPGQRVSGDYYDVVPLPDGRQWCLIADVTGEGVSAALLMANLQAVVRVTAPDADDPAALLRRWNALICRNTGNHRFITCLLMLLDPARRLLRCACAGHFAPLLLRPETRDPHEPDVDGGLPLGVSDQSAYATSDIELGRGPVTILVYTDGVVEAMNAEGRLFGHAALHASLAARPDHAPQGVIKHLRRCVADFVGAATPSDDITLLAVALE